MKVGYSKLNTVHRFLRMFYKSFIDIQRLSIGRRESRGQVFLVLLLLVFLDVSAGQIIKGNQLFLSIILKVR